MDSVRFGMELEVSSGGGDVLSHLYDAGHAGDDSLHAYHCGKDGGCDECDPRRSGPDWTAQEDCTADAEFISRILQSHTPEADAALAALADALVAGRASHDDDTGLHVHVDAAPFVDDDAALVRMWRMWLTYGDDVAKLAAMSYGRIRGYASQSKVTPQGMLGYDADGDTVARFYEADTDDAYAMLDHYRSAGHRTSAWLSGGRGAGTFEFRVWNSTRSHWRIRMAVYVSVGMTLAVLNGHDARPDDGLGLLDVIGEYLPDDVWMAAVKQLLANEAA